MKKFMLFACVAMLFAACSSSTDLSTIGFAVGFVLMMILDVVLG